MRNILTINAGSSSIRFALFQSAARPIRVLDGKMERIGSPQACLWATRTGQAATQIDMGTAQGRPAVDFLVEWLEAQPDVAMPDAVGHRVVHGMLHSAPERVTPELLDELRRITPYDPEHMPREIELIVTLQRRYSNVPQVACFDTAFHRSMPLVAAQLPIPRRYIRQGVQRYGFHGLSYTFLMQELARIGDPAATQGRVILAHLGSGASLAAVHRGQCMDTSMGFTPAAGLVMGTRSGDLDPGLMSYLALTEPMNAQQFQTMVNHESGLIGISETSADVRDLLDREAGDPRAREALELFCYQAKKWIGSFAAVLGGVDTLVFAGGIGENAAPVRRRICDGLQFLGIKIEESLNLGNAPRISTDTAAVAVRVIHTDEESVIAELTAGLLGIADKGAGT
ncbi:MAG: acetate/propionate family kinase [Steroidobacteraceae bacterium]